MINYCIFVHANPAQLRRLIHSIHEPGQTRCFIHVDRKSNIEDYYFQSDGVFFIQDRMAMTWGTYSVVEAIISTLRYATNTVNDGYFILLSGMDLPIRKKSEIISFIEENHNAIFVKYEYFPTNKLKSGGLDRLKKYWFDIQGRGNLVAIDPHKFSKENLISLYRILKYVPSDFSEAVKCLLFNKRILPEEKLVYSEMWWAAPYEVVDKLILHVDRNPDKLLFYKRMKIPDESMLQSMILFLFINDISYVIHNKTLTFIEWSSYRWPRPTTFRLDDFWSIEQLQKQGQYFFARKFDERLDSDIIHKILSKIV